MLEICRKPHCIIERSRFNVIHVIIILDQIFRATNAHYIAFNYRSIEFRFTFQTQTFAIWLTSIENNEMEFVYTSCNLILASTAVRTGLLYSPFVSHYFIERSKIRCRQYLIFKVSIDLSYEWYSKQCVRKRAQASYIIFTAKRSKKQRVFMRKKMDRKFGPEVRIFKNSNEQTSGQVFKGCRFSQLASFWIAQLSRNFTGVFARKIAQRKLFFAVFGRRIAQKRFLYSFFLEKFLTKRSNLSGKKREKNIFETFFEKKRNIRYLFLM